MTLHRHKPVEAGSASNDHLWMHISSLPYFRGVLRAVEARFYENIDLPAPAIDLGCGDGHFASLAFQRKLEVGIDPWQEPLREAAARGGYLKVLEASGSSIPYPDMFFASAVSNSVLEHIPDLDPVLSELARVLQPGARLGMGPLSGFTIFALPQVIWQVDPGSKTLEFVPDSADHKARLPRRIDTAGWSLYLLYYPQEDRSEGLIYGRTQPAGLPEIEAIPEIPSQ